jgi:class 3 adenylate cyclase/FtsZ-binding cell division protein ZapB
MSLFDNLTGKKEITELKQEIAKLKKELKKIEFEASQLSQKNIALLDNSHSFFERLKLLVGTLESGQVMRRTWDLLNSFLSIKKGAVFDKTAEGWKAIFLEGFKEPELLIPFSEESMITASEKLNSILSLEYIKKQDDLSYLHRRGLVPDTKIVCPVKISGKIQRLLVICHYGGNIFDSENDISLLETISRILGLVLTNTKILEEQKEKLSKRSKELEKVRGIFSKMVSPEIINHIEKNPNGISLGGERQNTALFFADIRGFTQMSENHTPEVIIALLNKFFTMLTNIIIEEKGTLDKFMGDAAMVLFGTPVELPNASLNAVNAAQKIQRKLQELMPQWESEGIPRFEVGIGINLQEVIIGNIGSERLSNFTAIGDGVNIASRMCSAAKGGEIIISQSVYDQIANDFDGQFEMKDMQFKGKAQKITAYVLNTNPETSSASTIACPGCQNSLAATAKFCGNCGYRL